MVITKQNKITNDDMLKDEWLYMIKSLPTNCIDPTGSGEMSMFSSAVIEHAVHIYLTLYQIP